MKFGWDSCLCILTVRLYIRTSICTFYLSRNTETFNPKKTRLKKDSLIFKKKRKEEEERFTRNLVLHSRTPAVMDHRYAHARGHAGAIKGQLLTVGLCYWSSSCLSSSRFFSFLLTPLRFSEDLCSPEPSRKFSVNNATIFLIYFII